MASADGWLSPEQAQALRELAQATLSSSTEVLSDLVLRRVVAGSPELRVTSWQELMQSWTGPRIIVRVEYVSGVEGTNLLILEAAAARIIADLMMGELAADAPSGELDELHLSALAEAMNQMMGSAATALSERLGRSVIISPPTTRLQTVDGEGSDPPAGFPGPEGAVVVLSFPLRIEDELSAPVDSRVVQVFPVDFARRLASEYLNRQVSARPAAPQPAPAASQVSPSDAGASARAGGAPSGGAVAPAQAASPWQAPELMPAPPPHASQPEAHEPEDRIPMEVIKRITVPVTVRLGQAYLPLEEVLRLSRGSIVPLDVMDGQPVDVLVSGTLVARGEVVVVREHFGVRITELVRPEGTGR